MDKIFVSYSSKDRTFVDTFLLSSQEYKNVKLWASHKGSMSSGQNFKQKIISEIDNSMGSIIFVSKTSLTSEFINETELPHIFEKKQKNKKYKVALIFIDECVINENLYLKDLHFINSVSTPLKFSSSNQIDEISRRTFNFFNLKLKSKKSLLKGLLFSSMILFIGFSLINQFSDSEEVINEVIEEVVNNENEVIEEDSNITCFGPEIEQFWKDSYIYSPLKTDLNKAKVDCNSSMTAQIYYSESLNVAQDDLNDSLSSSLRNDATTSCANKFKLIYGYGSTETLFDFQLLFTEDENGYLNYSCIAVFISATTQAFTTFTNDLINLNIEEYRANNGMFLKSIFSLNEKECFNNPEWQYGNSEDRFSEDLEVSGVYTVYCNSPHNAQVVKKFMYIPSENESYEDIEKQVFDKCSIFTEVFFGDLIEVKENVTLEGWPYLDIQLMADEKKLRSGLESEILCIVSNSGYMDIKVDFDYFNLLDKKLFQRNQYEKDFIEITNCPSDPIRGSMLDDEYIYGFPFTFVWNASSSDVESIYFKFKDIDYFIEYEYFAESDYEQNILNNWTSTQFVGPIGSKNGDPFVVSTELRLASGEVIKDVCSLELYFEN